MLSHSIHHVCANLNLKYIKISSFILIRPTASFHSLKLCALLSYENLIFVVNTTVMILIDAMTNSFKVYLLMLGFNTLYIFHS